MSVNSFGAKSDLLVGGKTYEIFRVDTVEGHQKLPFSMKVLLENLLRTEDGANTTPEHINALGQWDPTGDSDQEIQFTPARDMDAMDIGWDMGLMGPLPVIDPGGHPFLVYARSVVKRDDANDWQSFTTPNVVHAAPGTFDWMDVWDQNMPTWEVWASSQAFKINLSRDWSFLGDGLAQAHPFETM